MERVGKFDGYRFKNYKSYPTDSIRLSYNRITHIEKGYGAHIWCQTFGGKPICSTAIPNDLKIRLQNQSTSQQMNRLKSILKNRYHMDYQSVGNNLPHR